MKFVSALLQQEQIFQTNIVTVTLNAP